MEPFYLCGPTASGKTALALALAEKWGGEIVNAVAFQVYRGLEVLSAAPSAAERARCPHHLFGFVEPEDSMDAAKYESLARPIIDDIINRGKRPLVVGGSGLYLKFLTHGVARAPTGDEKIRAQLDQLTVAEIIDRLRDLDPEEAAAQVKQNANNRRHLTRALEICLLTGEKASSLRQNFKDPALAAKLDGIALTWPREALVGRIALRTARMMDEGAIDEVRNLPLKAATIRQAIGVREIEAHLKGDLTRDECEEQIAIATRQYAKRQRNWCRRESWLRPLDAARPLAEQVAEVG